MEVVAQTCRSSLFPEKISSRLLFRILFRLFVFAGALVVLFTEGEVWGSLVFTGIICLILLLSSRITDTTLPFLLMCVFLTKHYDSYETFQEFIWILVPVAASLLFHFIYYWRKPKPGPTFLGICAVSIALLLGGLGSIPFDTYASSYTLFYTLGLSLAMMAAYLLISPSIGRIESLRFCRYMYLVGVFAAILVFRQYLLNLDVFLSTKQNIEFVGKDNVATFLMLSLPFPFYYATRHRLHFLMVPCLYLALFFCNSRGGLIMGTIELILLFIIFAVYSPKNLPNRIICISSFVVFSVVFYFLLPLIFRFYMADVPFGSEDFLNLDLYQKIRYLLDNLLAENEARSNLVTYALASFKENPFFGSGIGDYLYSDLRYNMWLFQILGFMGTLGILCYGYQFIQRIVITVKNQTYFTIALASSYLGLFLMSQVNPGEFCPIPYALIAVCLFIIIEKNPVPNPLHRNEDQKKYNKEIKRFAIRSIRRSIKK